MIGILKDGRRIPIPVSCEDREVYVYREVIPISLSKILAGAPTAFRDVTLRRVRVEFPSDWSGPIEGWEWEWCRHCRSRRATYFVEDVDAFRARYA